VARRWLTALALCAVVTGGGKLREEGDQLRAAEIDPQHRPILLIDAV